MGMGWRCFKQEPKAMTVSRPEAEKLAEDKRKMKM